METLRSLGTQLISSFQGALENLIAYTPGILLAAAVIVVGWLAARLLRMLTIKGIQRLDWAFGQAEAVAEDGTPMRDGVAHAVAAVVFWTVFLSFTAAALAGLSAPIVEAWMESFLAFLPELVSGVAIILFGFIGGALARQIAEPAAASVGIAHSALLGRISQAVVIVTGFIIGSAHIGIDVTFVVQLLTVAAGAIFAGLALALALGTREHLSNIVGVRYLRKHHRIGERLRIGDFEGRIVDMADGYVFMETDSGDVSIPGSYCAREPFVKLQDGGSNEW